MTEWSKREDTRQGDMAHGITFVMFERRAHNVRAEVTLGEKKIHTDGVASLTLALDQHKYGDELIAQIFTRDAPRVLERRADGWTRVQIYLGSADDETALALETLAAAIRARCDARR